MSSVNSGNQPNEKQLSIAEILQKASQQREQILESIRHIRPDNPYALNFDLPGSPSKRPIGSASKEKKHYLQHLELLKEDTFTKLTERSKTETTFSKEKLDQAYHVVFYPESKTKESIEDKNPEQKTLNETQDHATKALADEKAGPLTPTDLSALFPNRQPRQMDKNEREKSDREPSLPGED